MRRSIIPALMAMTVLLAASLLGQAPSSPPPSYHFASGSSSLCIPAEVIADGLVFVQTSVNGHLGWFILDNATQGFTVDSDYAQRAALQVTGTAPARGGGANTINAGVVRDVEISLKGLSLTHRNLVVIALKPLEPAIGHTVDGIIGSRLFDDFVVAIDYERQCVSVYEPGQYRPSGKERALPARVDQHGFPFTDATIALPGIPPIQGSFLIDGGANTFADIYKPFSDAHKIPPSTMKLLNEPGMSTGGETLSREGRADRIDLGSFSIQNAPITFAQDVEGLMASQDYAGLIGAEFLERFTVVFDNREKRILLTPNRSYTEPAEYDESGLRIRADAPDFHRFVVARIVPDSPAAEAGIKPGDIISSVDNHLAMDLTLSEMRKMFRRTGSHYTLTITRGNSQLRVQLRLRPLI